MSPSQKALIVRLVKGSVSPKPMTLAIGDGANDVGMIQEAQVGVGVSGKEGRQAVNSSDFAIAQFKFLRKLIMVHGRWNYRRLSKCILYSFYKNIVLTFMLFYFEFVSAFSGKSLFEDMVYSGYNFFLGMPPLMIGMFDKVSLLGRGGVSSTEVEVIELKTFLAHSNTPINSRAGHKPTYGAALP